MTAVERLLKHTKSRRSDGRCGRPGCGGQSGDYYLCDHHREAMRLYMRDYRKRKREEARATAAA